VATFTTQKLTLGNIIRVPQDQPTIQAGINAAGDGDVVLVDEGTYTENINFKGKAITVASHYIMNGDTSHINNTVIDGSQPSHPDSGSVVYFVSGEDTTSVLKGFTITGGTGTPAQWFPTWFPEIAGGGIFVGFSGAKIEKNKIINNNTTASGTIFATAAGIQGWFYCPHRKSIFNFLTTQRTTKMQLSVRNRDPPSECLKPITCLVCKII
jgi:hypothetical protein